MADDARSTFTLRASRELLDRLKSEADAHSHSVNAEIIQRLETSFDDALLPTPRPEQFRHTFWEIQALDDAIKSALSVLNEVETEYSTPGWCLENRTQASDDFRESVHTKLSDLRSLRRGKQDYFLKIGGPYIPEPAMHRKERQS